MITFWGLAGAHSQAQPIVSIEPGGKAPLCSRIKHLLVMALAAK